MDQENIITKTLKKRKRFITFFSFLIFSLSVIKVLFFPFYEASTMIMVDYPKKDPTSIESERLPLGEYAAYIGIHKSLIKSRPVIEKVVEDLQLVKSNLKGRERKECLEEIIKKFQKKYVSVESDLLSPLVTITVQYNKPKMAADIANSIVKAYKDWNVDFQHNEVDKLIDYLDKELKLSKEHLQNSEKNLRKFREENKIIALPEEIRTYFQIIAEELKTQSQIIQAIKIKLLELDIELSRIKELYSDESPQVVYMKERIAQVKDKLNEETQKYELNKTYINKLKNVPKKEMILARLIRDVKINEAHYTFLLEELEKARLLKAKQTTENVKVISLAEVPLRPKEGMFHVALNTLIGVIVALGTVIALEAKQLFKIRQN